MFNLIHCMVVNYFSWSNLDQPDNSLRYINRGAYGLCHIIQYMQKEFIGALLVFGLLSVS